MKVKTMCNLKSKVLNKVWLKGSIISEPFPSDIKDEIKAVKDGRSKSLEFIYDPPPKQPLKLKSDPGDPGDPGDKLNDKR